MEKKLSESGIDWETRDNIAGFEADYDEESDILLLQSKDNRPAVSVQLGDMWIRVDPQTGEILGVEIEDFKRVFLKKHPEITKAKNQYVRPIADLVKLEHCMA